LPSWRRADGVAITTLLQRLTQRASSSTFSTW